MIGENAPGIKRRKPDKPAEDMGEIPFPLDYDHAKGVIDPVR